MKILLIITLILLSVLMLFLYCACKVSSECSRIEEQYLEKDKEE